MSSRTAALRVRRAEPGDREFVIQLAARLGQTRAAWRDYDEVVAGTQRQLAAAFDFTPVTAAIFIAVTPEDTPIGFAYVVTHADFFTGEAHGHLSEIAAIADGSGAGTALMTACEAWSSDHGYRYLSLNVNDANVDARNFYHRRSYVPEYRHLVKRLRPPEPTG